MIRSLSRLRLLALRLSWLADRSGTALIEFAMVLPVMLLLNLAGFEYSNAISCNRKVTITSRAVADLVSQYAIVASSQVDGILNDSSQIMTPFSPSAALIRVSEITTDGIGNSTVTWSRAINGSALTKNAPVTLPVGIKQLNNSIIFSEVNYAYVPSVGFGYVRPFSLSQSIYMAPRVSTSISCNDC